LTVPRCSKPPSNQKQTQPKKGENAALNHKLKINLKPEKIAVLLIIIAVAVGAVFTSVSGYRASHISEEKLIEFREAFDLPKGFMNVAAAGCCGKTANTYESFQAAFKSGATCIEVNVAFRGDGIPVLARGNEFVTERSEPLENILKFVKDHSYIKLFLNLKEFTNTEEVFSMINEYGLKEFVYLSDMDINSAEYIMEQYQNFHMIFTVPDGADLKNENVRASLVDGALKYGVLGFKCDIDLYTTEFAELLKNNNIMLIITGAHSKYQIYDALSRNPDGILTSRPDMLYDIMNIEKLFRN